VQKLYRLLSLVLAFTLVFSITLVSSAQEENELDIVETAVNAGNLETLVAAIQDADLVEALQDEGPYTVFAPIDAAFEDLPEGALDTLAEDPEGDLRQVLLYHVVQGLVLSTDLSDGMTVETLHGASLTISVTDDGVMVNGANVIQADIMAANGVIHLIDAVLLPPDEDEVMAAEDAVAEEEVAEEEVADEVDEEVDEEVTAEDVDQATIQELLEEFTPSIQVQDQVFRVREGQSVFIPELFATQDGWVVIHLDDGGVPGPVIGYEFVEAGPHFGLEVSLDEIQTEDTVLWAMLHVDEGVAGEYEFPGPDVPARLDGEIVMASFTALAPTVMVEDQPVVDGAITAEGVATASDSWLVIHRTGADGRPGAVIGYAPAAPGVTPNVTVELTSAVSEGDQLWAMLHYDLGVRGEFEFPGEDVPIRLADQVIMTSFTIVSDEADVAAAAEEVAEEEIAEEEIAEEDDVAVTAAPAAEAPAPATLPVTGGSLPQNNSSLGWMVSLLALILAGGIFFYRRRIA
jgi:uncharacterized surface protein with fasciclin (FAS1) repeats